ncbi:fatty-acyl-CoA synthase [Lentzea sp. NBRC 105346]|uniref:AMP-binding protein n=1 Tax=Lentzea sp. NBRC 105346 TaxID=3032205 RepID=UPI0024A4FDCE|nr:AMP-binding protein [Lentzea sp. NBRC 105346]GLZ33477.1 fatty-acyl-CoA synthase [Lentzea sp. NBRC 105346]
MAGLRKAFRDAMGRVHSLRVLSAAGMVSLTNFKMSLQALREVSIWGPNVTAVRRAVRLNPDGVAVVDERGSVTYRQLDRRSTAIAQGLRALGVQHQHVVAVMCRNHRGMVETLLGCAKLGVRALLVNTGFAAPVVLDLLRREGVSLVIHDEEFTPLFHQLPPHIPRWLAWSRDGLDRRTPTLDQLVSRAPRGELEPPREPGIVIQLTSGTTGVPKGTYREIKSVLTASDFLDRIPMGAGESTFIAAPIFHAVGYSLLTLALSLGSRAVLQRRFDPRKTLWSVQGQKCTTLVLVPTMLQRIVELDRSILDSFDLSHLRVVFCSGATIPPDLVERTIATFGPVLYNLYGSTEVAVATVATPEDLSASPSTVGLPPHNCVVRIYDSSGNRITTPYVTGRIYVRGSLTVDGYTDGTQKEMIDGLVSTGDLGHTDAAGRLYFDGREDDMIVSGGENVYPVEVENLLMTHYRIRDAAVLGVPDPEYGQRLRAFVVPVAGARIDVRELREFVRTRLARHKVPREVVVVPKLPRNATGKVLRRQLMSIRFGPQPH